jgi:hypothetical protein
MRSDHYRADDDNNIMTSKKNQNETTINANTTTGKAGRVKRSIITTASAVVLALLAITIVTPAKASPLAASASIWSLTEYVAAIFGGKDEIEKKRPASPFDDVVDMETARDTEPMGADAVNCAPSGMVISVPAGGSIQAAINSASPVGGDRIVVAAGTFVEQLTINKCITIEGAGVADTIIQSPPTLAASSFPVSRTRSPSWKSGRTHM